MVFYDTYLKDIEALSSPGEAAAVLAQQKKDAVNARRELISQIWQYTKYTKTKKTDKT